MADRSDTTKTAATAAYAPGDRVRLRASGAMNWIDLGLRRRATAGTPATVAVVIGTALPPARRSYRINFDATGRMRAKSEIIPIEELELAQ